MKRPREPELKFPYMIPPHMIGNRIMVIEVDPWKMSVADTLRRDLKRLKEKGARRWLGCLFAAWKLQLAYFARNSLQFARLLACGASCSKNRLLLWEVWAAWKTSSRGPPLSCLYGPCLGCSGPGLRSCTVLAVSLVLHNATGTTGVAENWVELIERR
jgi:hypothetical protein